MVAKDIPIIIMDSLDKYWAGEYRTRLPLQGVQVPVASVTMAGSKRVLAADLTAQLRLLMLLSSSHDGEIAQLREDLACLGRLWFPPKAGSNGKAR